MSSGADRRIAALVIVIVITMAGLAPALAVQDPPDPSLSLKVRQSGYLKLGGISDFGGPPLDYDADPNSRRGESGDWCHRDVDLLKDGTQTIPCREVRINVAEADAWRLRVAINTPHIAPVLDVELWGPNGSLAPHRTRTPSLADRSDIDDSNSQFRRDISLADGAEVYAYRPGIGEWVLRIVPFMVSQAELPEIEVRAKLEALPNPNPQKPLLPNLRPEMPHGRFFLQCQDWWDTPPTPGPGSGQGHLQPAGDPTSQQGQCLRFPFGFQNAGSGPLVLDFDDTAVGLTVPVRQKIYRDDATPETYDDNPLWRPPIDAGTATWHHTHGHYHYDALFSLELLPVVDQGKLGSPWTTGVKRGSCAHDWILVGFEHFRQDQQGIADSGDGCHGAADKPTDYRIALSAGWADLYGPNFPDNYVPFPPRGKGHGQWVLRISVDPDNRIVEQDESDNVGYAYIEITRNEATGGDRVKLLERGRGTSPWDVAKTEVTQYGQS